MSWRFRSEVLPGELLGVLRCHDTNYNPEVYSRKSYLCNYVIKCVASLWPILSNCWKIGWLLCRCFACHSDARKRNLLYFKMCCEYLTVHVKNNLVSCFQWSISNWNTLVLLNTLYLEVSRGTYYLGVTCYSIAAQLATSNTFLQNLFVWSFLPSFKNQVIRHGVLLVRIVTYGVGEHAITPESFSGPN